ncbi:molybdopterin-containing oxidoreductase family protein [Brevibacillus centrosporus]|uniref:Anaerobic selenocysteine-containing dehydrogenase n=1 Tax=Brevibacillus centrosporus TaxID=54910 RepID=A0A1I3S4J6_9BACL|nr:molybdopterin oxidoreductase family protein [Brevibacillus centrosporus]MED4909258.1 molybdopterin oxidoreductase family protein [Brevibacillus centrosporus]SFJ53595.1 Anaerobic selenocysteine-containing dehydrogenase [Brevibacillus centrosporus]
MIQRKTVCPHDCPDTCSIIAKVEDGKVVSTKGDPTHPFTRGALCSKVLRYGERIYSPDRLLYPMRRVGEKGEGRFERISWEEALDEITARLKQAVSLHRSETVYCFQGSGNMGIIQMNAHFPFFHKLGASRGRGNLCSPAADIGWNYTVGAMVGSRPESVAKTDLLIVWGSNMVSSNMHMLAFFKEAKKQGAQMIVIDPYKNRTAKQADWYIPIRPGTDAALALGMMYVLVAEDLIDPAYIAAYTIGFPELEQSLWTYTPKRVEEITGVPAEHVQRLARMYGQARAPFIRVGIGLSRSRRGGMAIRTIACLPGLVGAFHKPGGGALMFTSDAFPINMDAILCADLLPRETRILDNVRLGQNLLALHDPPITCLFVTGSNPVLSCPDSGLVRKGLLRDDLFTVVHEQFMTDTVSYADIVLPATTSFESEDVFKSYGHTYLQRAEPVIAPLGEARSNFDFYMALGNKMGFSDAIFSKSMEQVALELFPRFQTDNRQREAFLAGQTMELMNIEEVFAHGFPTPSGKLEFYSAQMEKDGYFPLPVYLEVDEEEGDLHLLTPPAHFTLNTSFGGVEALREKERRPTIQIHPVDAMAQGIEEDGWIEVYNRRGQVRLWARLTEDIPPGTAVAEGVWWTKHTPDGNPINLLTSDRLTDMGWGSTLHDNRVSLRKMAHDS